MFGFSLFGLEVACSKQSAEELAKANHPEYLVLSDSGRADPRGGAGMGGMWQDERGRGVCGGGGGYLLKSRHQDIQLRCCADPPPRLGQMGCEAV